MMLKWSGTLCAGFAMTSAAKYPYQRILERMSSSTLMWMDDMTDNVHNWNIHTFLCEWGMIFAGCIPLLLPWSWIGKSSPAFCHRYRLLDLRCFFILKQEKLRQLIGHSVHCLYQWSPYVTWRIYLEMVHCSRQDFCFSSGFHPFGCDSEGRWLGVWWAYT